MLYLARLRFLPPFPIYLHYRDAQSPCELPEDGKFGGYDITRL